MAGRRLDEQRFDHGAVCFEARHPDFRRAVESWLEEGIVAVWRGTWMQVTQDGEWTGKPVRRRYTGLPGMPAVARHLLRNIGVHAEQQISRLERTGSGWMLHTEAGQVFGPFDSVILAMPSPQAAALLQTVHPAVAERLQRVPWAVTRTVMAGFHRPIPGLDWSGADVEGPILGRIIRNQTKPHHGTAAFAECLVLHATADWSAAHAEADPERVSAAMLEELVRLIGQPVPQPDVLSVHRWKYAEPLRVLGGEEAAAIESVLQGDFLGICGDWVGLEQNQGGQRGGCCGVETGWLSGINAAGRVIRGLRREVRVEQRGLFDAAADS